ncbi:MAG: hypothetical protein ACFFEN_17580 [Candidatus Thorarchaeota archaeon]
MPRAKMVIPDAKIIPLLTSPDSALSVIAPTKVDRENKIIPTCRESFEIAEIVINIFDNISDSSEVLGSAYVAISVVTLISNTPTIKKIIAIKKILIYPFLNIDLILESLELEFEINPTFFFS